MSLDHEYELIEITDVTIGALLSLVGESKREGYHFLQRTLDDWESGANKFDRPGEKLWGLFIGKELIGVGGLNIDPYSLAPTVGRVRHLYVREARRREGYATLLMHKIMAEARTHFTVLRLFTDNAGAAAFYEKLDFAQTGEYKASHFIRLPAPYAQ
jgi:GNAT superfamily N-acetyltransferase